MSIERMLPEELLANIISSASPNTLPDLARTSKTLNRITTPYLYSNITLGGGDGDQDTFALVPFAYTIFTAPKVPFLVNSIVVNEWYASQEEECEDATSDKTEWPVPEDQEVEKVLRKVCARYTCSDTETDELYKKVKSGRNEDAILVLLLASLPKVKRLDFSFAEADKYPVFVSVLELVTARFKSEDNLQLNSTEDIASSKPRSDPAIMFAAPVDIMIKGTSDKYPSNPDVLAAFFNLPNLHAIYAWRIGDSEMAEHEEENACSRLKPRSCPVEYIEVRFSKLHKDDLKFLMNATIPGKLKVFNYEIGGVWTWVTLKIPAIMESLEPHHDTLEYLGLSHESDFYPFDLDDPDDESHPVCFTPFKALKYLKVAPVFIWGDEGLEDITKTRRPENLEIFWKALPASLEDLWLTNAEQVTRSKDGAAGKFVPDCLLPALELIVQKKSEAFPNLRRLRIEFELKSWQSDFFETLAFLVKVANADGIQITVILDDWPGSPIVEVEERNWGWNEDVQWGECFGNQGYRKKWINATEEPDLGQTLRDAKSRVRGYA
jgi:hypothetical protein